MNSKFKTQLVLEGIPDRELDRALLSRVHLDKGSGQLIATDGHIILSCPKARVEGVEADEEILNRIKKVTPSAEGREPNVILSADYLRRIAEFLNPDEFEWAHIEIFIDGPDKAVLFRLEGSESYAVLMPIKQVKDRANEGPQEPISDPK